MNFSSGRLLCHYVPLSYTLSLSAEFFVNSSIVICTKLIYFSPALPTAPRNLRVLRRVNKDALLLGWITPEVDQLGRNNGHLIKGYKVCTCPCKAVFLYSFHFRRSGTKTSLRRPNPCLTVACFPRFSSMVNTG